MIDWPKSNNFLQALRGQPVARTPFQELEVSVRQVEATLGRAVGVGSMALAVEDYVEFTLASGQQAMYFNALWKAGRIYHQDDNGLWQYVGGMVRSREDFARLKAFDVAAALQRIVALAQAGRKHGLAVMISFPSPFRLALFAMGYEEFFLRLYDDRAFVTDLMDYFTEPVEQYLAELLSSGVDAFVMSVSICAGTGPMLSPELLRQLWLPRAQRFLHPIVQRGIPVALHTDGDFSGVADLLLELPVSAIHPFEVTGRLSIRDFKRKYGQRVTVWGNIDLAGVLTRGTAQDVRQDVRQHIESLSPGGRYILGSSHEITPDVPVENWLALVQGARDHAR